VTTDAQSPPRRREKLVDSIWLPSAGAVLITVLAAAFILFANRGTWFLLDDWAYLAQRAPDLSAGTLFTSQNGNWATTQVLVYRVLAELFGMGSYLPFRLTALAIHLGCCALVYVLARRRLGPWWALVPLALVLVTRGWETVLWPFQMGQMLSILTGLGALVALDRRDWRGDLAASVLLVLSLASSSFGPPLVLAVGVELVFSRRRALWVLVAPAAAYLWWQEVYNSALPPQGSTALSGIRYALELGWDILPGGPAAVLGTSFPVGRVVLIAVVALAIARTVFERRVPARLAGLLVAYVAYWILVAWARSEAPDLGHAPRYVDLGVVLFVLAVVELFAGLLPERWPPWAQRPVRALRRHPAFGPAAFMLVVLIAARGALLTADAMNHGMGVSFRAWGQRMLAQQAALGVGRPILNEQSPFYLETSGSFALAFPLGQIEATVKRWGGELYPGEASLRDRPMDARRYADQALARAEGATVVDEPPAAAIATDGPPLRVLSSEVPVTAKNGCVRWSATHQARVRVAVPPAGLRVGNSLGHGDIATALVRWADRPLQAEAIVTPGRSATVRPRADRSRRPWALEVYGADAKICSIPG
jgi:hypothetical protein